MALYLSAHDQKIELVEMKSQLDSHLQTNIARSRVHANRLHFLEGEKSPWLLPWRLRKETAQNSIAKISASNGSIKTDLVEINQELYHFFVNLYQTQHHNGSVLIDNIIKQAQLPQL